MMQSSTKYILMILLSSLLVLSSCIREREYSVRTTPEAKDNGLTLRLRLTTGSEIGKTKAETPQEGEYELGSTEDEHKIRNITVAIMKYNDATVPPKEIFEDFQTIFTGTDDLPEVFPAEGISLNFYFRKISNGKKKIYIIANASSQVLSRIASTPDITERPTYTSGKDADGLLRDFITLDENVSGSYPLMTATVRKDGNDIITITPDTDTHIDVGTVIVSKFVSKVLLTVTQDDERPEFAMVRDEAISEESSREGKIGWVKISDIRYMLNVMRRTNYIFPEYTEDGFQKGPGAIIGNYLESTSDDVNTDNQTDDEKLKNFVIKSGSTYNRDFVVYSPNALKEILSSANPPKTLVANPEVYNPQRINVGSANHYTSGLYAMPNLVTKTGDPNAAKYSEWDYRNVTTYIVISMKYVPRILHKLGENNSMQHVELTSPSQVSEFLPEKTVDQGTGVTVTYPEGTFWTLKMDNDYPITHDGQPAGPDHNFVTNYYDYDTMIQFCENSKRVYDNATEQEKAHLRVYTTSDFNRYDGGNCYFFSFIDGTVGSDHTVDYGSSMSWGIQSNHYYILNISNISLPGKPFPGADMIKIPMQVLSWKNKGNTVIDLK